MGAAVGPPRTCTGGTLSPVKVALRPQASTPQRSTVAGTFTEPEDRTARQRDHGAAVPQRVLELGIGLGRRRRRAAIGGDREELDVGTGERAGDAVRGRARSRPAGRAASRSVRTGSARGSPSAARRGRPSGRGSRRPAVPQPWRQALQQRGATVGDHELLHHAIGAGRKGRDHRVAGQLAAIEGGRRHVADVATTASGRVRALARLRRRQDRHAGVTAR